MRKSSRVIKKPEFYSVSTLREIADDGETSGSDDSKFSPVKITKKTTTKKGISKSLKEDEDNDDDTLDEQMAALSTETLMIGKLSSEIGAHLDVTISPDLVRTQKAATCANEWVKDYKVLRRILNMRPILTAISTG